MHCPNTLEYSVPVWSTEICGCSETSNGILLGIGIVDHDVCRIIGLNLGSQVCMDLNEMSNILSLDGQKQGAKPLERAEITANPEEIDLVQPRLLLWVVTPVPDTFQDRGERSDTNTGTDEYGNLVFENVFRCRPERTVDVDCITKY